MSDDDSLARMLREADALARDRPPAAPAPAAPSPAPAPAPVTRGLVERTATWWRVDVPLRDLSHAWPAALLSVIVLGGAVAWLAPQASLVVALLGAVVALASLVGAWRWWRFRAWRARVPFPIEGWSALVDAPDFGRDEAWRHGEVRVTPRPGGDAAELDRLLDAAFALYARDAQRAFHACEGVDRRHPWIARQGSARGSFNRHVARHLKALVEARLAPIHRRTGAIGAVVIEVDAESFEARRPRGEDG